MPSKYDFEKFPPAPVLEIRVSVPYGAAGDEIHIALIDTGSDFTIMPLSLVAKMDAPESRLANVRALWGESRIITLYYVDIHFETGTIPNVEVIGSPDASRDNEIILGRNVLNRLILLLDGHEAQTDILKQRPRRI